jgi:hypothetical protein
MVPVESPSNRTLLKNGFYPVCRQSARNSQPPAAEMLETRLGLFSQVEIAMRVTVSRSECHAS